MTGQRLKPKELRQKLENLKTTCYLFFTMDSKLGSYWLGVKPWKPSAILSKSVLCLLVNYRVELRRVGTFAVSNRFWFWLAEHDHRGRVDYPSFLPGAGNSKQSEKLATLLNKTAYPSNISRSKSLSNLMSSLAGNTLVSFCWSLSVSIFAWMCLLGTTLVGSPTAWVECESAAAAATTIA